VPKPSTRRLSGPVALTAVVLLNACGFYQPALALPEHQRAVEFASLARSVAADGSVANLADGRAIDLRVGTPAFDIGTIQAGSLVVGGTTESWFGYTATKFPADCFVLYTRGRDEGTWVTTELGVRFSKAPEYDPGSDLDGVLDEPTAHFCLNARGELTSYGH
jgi:hypothetical protein